MSLSSELLVREVSPTPPSLASHSVSKGMVVCNWVVILSVCITVLCVFDPTGRTFVKLRATKRRQRNLRTYNLRSVGQLGGWTVP
jgi:sn1-specific diacylglycerol lipase